MIQTVSWRFRHYEKAQQNTNKIDFDDQKLRPWERMRASANMTLVIGSRYDEVIAHEFQDINRLDFEQIRMISGTAWLVVTGDDDQAIYGFRCCSPDYIIDFAEYVGRRVVTHELKINYRCPRNIVEHATTLIHHNKHRVEKSPNAHRQQLASIKVVGAGSAYIEAKSIVTFIKKVRTGHKALGFSEFIVLYRTNAQSLPIQVEFILNDVRTMYERLRLSIPIISCPCFQEAGARRACR